MTYETILTLVTLTGLEIVLGIDNVVFIALLVHHAPEAKRKLIRTLGISLALILRILLLTGATWIASLTKPVIVILHFPLSARDLLMLLGGIFLLVKGIYELYGLKQELGSTPKQHKNIYKETICGIISQVIFIDFVLSFDSVITAVGLSNNLTVMIIAIVISMFIMLLVLEPIEAFLEAHPNIKVLAICFVALVGVYLILLGMHIDISKGYMYSAMGFSLIVETINHYFSKQHKHKKEIK